MRRLFLTVAVIQCVASFASSAKIDEPALLSPQKVSGVAHMQLKVPDQFEKKDGNAECALQALYNGIVIVKALLAGNTQVELKLLFDNEAREREFAQWRRIVSSRRAKNSKKKALTDQLKKMIAKNRKNDRRKATLLFSECPNFAESLLGLEAVEEGNVLKYEFTPEQIRTCMIDRLEKRHTQSKEEFSLTVGEDELDSYVGLQKIKLDVEVSNSSDWLLSNEIDRILSESGLVLPDNVKTFHVGDTIPVSTSLLQEPKLQSDNKELTDFQKNFRGTDGSCTGIFLVYAKGQNTFNMFSRSKTHEELQKTSSNGHWYCVLAHRVGKTRQYIIADSAHNYQRFEDQRFKELVGLLEGGSSNSVAPDKSVKVVKVPSANIVDIKLLSEKLTPVKQSKSFIREHPYITGLFVGLVTALAVYKYRQRYNKDITTGSVDELDPLIRSVGDLDPLTHADIHLYRSFPHGTLHEPYIIA